MRSDIGTSGCDNDSYDPIAANDEPSTLFIDITFIECNHSFYKRNIYPDIDEIQDKIDSLSNITILIEKEFSNLIEDKKQYFKEDS